MRFLITAFILSAVLSAPALAQSDGAGTTVFSFASLNYDARSIGMAGAAAGMADDIYGIVNNPAALATITAPRGAICFRPVVLDVGGGPVSYAFPIRQYGVLAVSLLGFSEGSLAEINVDKELTGVTYYAGGGAGSVTWAQKLKDYLLTGISVKGLYHRFSSTSNYAASADGAALDAGVQYRILKDRFIAGAMIKNFGFMTSPYTPNGQTYNLPFSLTLGCSYVLRNVPSLRLACDLEQANDDYLVYRPGFEIAVYKNNLFFRGGYVISQNDLEHIIN